MNNPSAVIVFSCNNQEQQNYACRQNMYTEKNFIKMLNIKANHSETEKSYWLTLNQKTFLYIYWNLVCLHMLEVNYS